MREGSLEAPARRPLDWQAPDFADEAKLEAELRRVFDICHGCRRCFNLCASFPRLFALIDGTPEETLDEVPAASVARSVLVPSGIGLSHTAVIGGTVTVTWPLVASDTDWNPPAQEPSALMGAPPSV